MSKQHARPPPIMIPLISEVIVVLEADYIHSRDNEQGVLCVGEVKFPPTELDHLVPRPVLKKVFAQNVSHWKLRFRQFRRSHNFSRDSHSSIGCKHECLDQGNLLHIKQIFG